MAYLKYIRKVSCRRQWSRKGNTGVFSGGTKMALDQAYPLLARISSIVAIQVLMLKPSSVQNPVPGVRASWSQLRYAPAGRNYGTRQLVATTIQAMLSSYRKRPWICSKGWQMTRAFQVSLLEV